MVVCQHTAQMHTYWGRRAARRRLLVLEVPAHRGAAALVHLPLLLGAALLHAAAAAT